jgi:hypothetical protein
MISSLFIVLVLEIWSHFSPGWPELWCSYFKLPDGCWDDRCATPRPGFFSWDELLHTFLPMLAWNCDTFHLNLLVAWEDCVHQNAQLILYLLNVLPPQHHHTRDQVSTHVFWGKNNIQTISVWWGYYSHCTELKNEDCLTYLRWQI